MSTNSNIRSEGFVIKMELSQRTSLPTETIQQVGNRAGRCRNAQKFKDLLTGNLEKYNYTNRDKARHALEQSAMFFAGDLEVATEIVLGSELTKGRNEMDTEAVRTEILHVDRELGQRRFIDRETWFTTANGDEEDENPSSSDDGLSNSNDESGNTEYSSQKRRSTVVSSLDQLDPDRSRKQEMRKDLFGI